MYETKQSASIKSKQENMGGEGTHKRARVTAPSIHILSILSYILYVLYLGIARYANKRERNVTRKPLSSLDFIENV